MKLSNCVVCNNPLTPQPLYPETVAMTCVRHGDHFIYRERGKEDRVIFRPFEIEHFTPKKNSPKTYPARKFAPGAGKPGYVIRCEQNGAIYTSTCKAAEALGISQCDISKHLRGLRTAVRGYTFTRMEDDGLGNLEVVPRPVCDLGGQRKKVAIRCQETGQVFESVRDAARILGLNRGNLHHHLSGVKAHPRVGGMTFVKVVSQKIHAL